jgi:hypothetical protein
VLLGVRVLLLVVVALAVPVVLAVFGGRTGQLRRAQYTGGQRDGRGGCHERLASTLFGVLVSTALPC